MGGGLVGLELRESPFVSQPHNQWPVMSQRMDVVATEAFSKGDFHCLLSLDCSSMCSEASIPHTHGSP